MGVYYPGELRIFALRSGHHAGQNAGHTPPTTPGVEDREPVKRRS
ncbi:hypothetical protein [Methanoculleus bourgensis]